MGDTSGHAWAGGTLLSLVSNLVDMPILLQRIQGDVHSHNQAACWHPSFSPSIHGCRIHIRIRHICTTAQRLQDCHNLLRSSALTDSAMGSLSSALSMMRRLSRSQLMPRPATATLPSSA
jgi:hypothetical protein